MNPKISWKRVFDQWPAKVLSIAAALLLFFYNRVDTLGEKTFSIPLRLITDTSLVPADPWQHRVKLTVRGPKDVLGSLSENEVEAIADFSDRSIEGFYTVPIEIHRRGPAADLENLEFLVSPLDLKLRLEKKVIKSVPVVPQFSGQPGRDFELSGFRVSPSKITVEGPSDRMSKLVSVVTEPIDLRGKTDDFNLRVRAMVNSPLLDFPLGDSVEVIGKMKSSLQTMTFPIIVPILTGLNAGLKVRSLPTSVTVRVRGNKEALANLSADKIQVEADLSNFNAPGEAFDIPIKVLLPSGVDLIEVSPPVTDLILEKKP